MTITMEMEPSPRLKPRFRRWSPEWEGLAKEVRETVGRHQSSAPVRVSSICKDLGVEIVFAQMPARISGEIRPTADGGCKIKVNRYESQNRQRFTAAHELAHFLLHRDLIVDQGGIVDTVLFRSNVSNRIEAQANRLAADILMPAPLIETFVEQYFEGDFSAVRISDAAEQFGVSEAAMAFRLGV